MRDRVRDSDKEREREKEGVHRDAEREFQIAGDDKYSFY